MTTPDAGVAWRGSDSLARVEQPLESVVGLAELLCDRSRDVSAAARNEMIEQLAIRAQAAHHAVRNLAVADQLARGEIEFDVETVELRELVESVAQEWTLASRGARITVTGSIDAIGDSRWVARIVRNIFEDAIDRGCRSIDVRISESHSKLVVEIDEDGAEIPDEELLELGSEHHRLVASTWDGSIVGIGVAVARGLAKGMGGEVRFFRTGDRNTCELTLRKQSSTTSRRRQLPDIAVEPKQPKPQWDDLVELLDGESVSMVYQSIVDIRSDPGSPKVVGYESFARFPYASPPEWFKLAGSSGVGTDLELLALRQGIEGFAEREDGSILALNLSNSTLLSPGLFSALEGIDPGRVVLELSDTARIRSYEVTRRAVDSLRARGVRLAVDDVGAGEVDMWHILRLDPEIIKLDRHLVADENVRRNNALIRGLTAMARDLGIMVIAEAIETDTERRRLLDLGVEFGQGYLFGKPGPVEWKSRVLSDLDWQRSDLA